MFKVRELKARFHSVLVLAKLDSAHGNLERVNVGLLATGKSEVDIGLRKVHNNRVSAEYGLS